MNKKIISKKTENKIRKFYLIFKQSGFYYGILIAVVFLGLLLFPTGEIIQLIFPSGPFIVGPYIMLILMLIAFSLYKYITLYLYVLVLFIINTLISFIGVAMGSRDGIEVLIFFLPIAIFLIINIFIAVLTYKYK
ncbi:hypothetical protein [Anaerosphaera multitolerans]|uniref:Uncharacterized protein n=1 Tax=Anaerosphaera multitolerans TaxID=2487351 RepID=A0A437S8R9_9FIRM|nr:hypothetical protein [Anaerosphaera multitolerans]RVU55496.1 hypothetical protein EF514_01850 [Anaerosphaera multitolerans]